MTDHGAEHEPDDWCEECGDVCYTPEYAEGVRLCPECYEDLFTEDEE